MAETKIITKQLAGTEDIITGIGTVNQQRSTGIKTIKKINPSEMKGAIVVANMAELLALPIVKLGDTKTVIVQGDSDVGLFTYDDTRSTINNGLNVFNGWVKQGDLTVPTVNDLPNLIASSGTVCTVTDSIRGGLFTYDDTRSMSTDDGTIFAGWVRQDARPVNVKWFGAKGDGNTDDTIAINKAAESVNSSGGGDILYPPGTYMVGYYKTDNTDGEQHMCIQLYSNTHHIGSGRDIVKIKNIDNSNSHTIYGIDVSSSSITGITIDGNRDNQVVQNPSTGNDPAGIEFLGLTQDVVVKYVTILNTPDYGIGFQGSGINVINTTLSNIIIKNSGADAIDAKNSSNLSYGNTMDTIYVSNVNPSAGQDTQQCGINVRDGWKLSNIDIKDLKDDIVGIRFNAGESSDTGGKGARLNSLTNFTIESSSEDNDVIGIMLDGRSVTVATGNIHRCNKGIQIRQRENIITGVYIETVSKGIETVNNASFATEANDNILSNIIVRNASYSGIHLATDRNKVSSCDFTSCDTALTISGNSNYITTSDVTGNTSKISISGIDTVIDNVFGAKTVSHNRTANFALDTTDLQTVSINHGLYFKPDTGSVVASIVAASHNDWSLAHMEIDVVDSTKVDVKVKLETASATSGATASVAISSYSMYSMVE